MLLLVQQTKKHAFRFDQKLQVTSAWLHLDVSAHEPRVTTHEG